MTAAQFDKTVGRFEAKIIKVAQSRFVRSLAEGGSGISFGFSNLDQERPFSYSLKGPDDESTDAIMNTWRILTQDNDPLSLRNISKQFDTARANSWITPATHREFLIKRGTLNRYLDGNSFLKMKLFVADDGLVRIAQTYGLQDDGLLGYRMDRPSRRWILDVFLYGEISHSKEAKADIIEWMRTHGGTYALYRNEFNNILVRSVRTMERLRQRSIVPALQQVRAHLYELQRSPVPGS